jgi:hypothetical protein
METSELFKRMRIARIAGDLKWISMTQEMNRRGWRKTMTQEGGKWTFGGSDNGTA